MKYTPKKKINKTEWEKSVKECNKRIHEVMESAKVDNESLRRQFTH